MLDAGRLVEVGKHGELMRKGGVYKGLGRDAEYGLQLKAFVNVEDIRYLV